MIIFKNIWDKIKVAMNMYIQYTYSFSFPIICVIMPFIISYTVVNFWWCFLYLITIPALVTNMLIIEEINKKGHKFADFWKLPIFNREWWD